MRVPPAEFRGLDLEVHALLADVPLQDVSAVDLPDGGRGRTISDVRRLMARQFATPPSQAVRLLFELRLWLGRRFGWDATVHARPETSYLHRLSDDLRRRSLVPP